MDEVTTFTAEQLLLVKSMSFNKGYIIGSFVGLACSIGSVLIYQEAELRWKVRKAKQIAKIQ